MFPDEGEHPSVNLWTDSTTQGQGQMTGKPHAGDQLKEEAVQQEDQPERAQAPGQDTVTGCKVCITAARHTPS